MEIWSSNTVLCCWVLGARWKADASTKQENRAAKWCHFSRCSFHFTGIPFIRRIRHFFLVSSVRLALLWRAFRSSNVMSLVFIIKIYWTEILNETILRISFSFSLHVVRVCLLLFALECAYEANTQAAAREGFKLKWNGNLCAKKHKIFTCRVDGGWAAYIWHLEHTGCVWVSIIGNSVLNQLSCVSWKI